MYDKKTFGLTCLLPLSRSFGSPSPARGEGRSAQNLPTGLLVLALLKFSLVLNYSALKAVTCSIHLSRTIRPFNFNSVSSVVISASVRFTSWM
jgi:hypothetical protein